MGWFSKPVAAPTHEELVAEANATAADAVSSFHRAADDLDRSAQTLVSTADAAAAEAANKNALASEARAQANANAVVASKIRSLVS